MLSTGQSLHTCGALPVSRPISQPRPVCTASSTPCKSHLCQRSAGRSSKPHKAFTNLRPRSTFVPTAAAASAADTGTPKIRIKLKSYWKEMLSDAVDHIKEAATSTNASFSGPVYLPTRKKVWTVLTSPHVNKDAREQFEIRIHSRLMDIKDLTPETIDRLMFLELPSGVNVEVKL